MKLDQIPKTARIKVEVEFCHLESNAEHILEIIAFIVKHLLHTPNIQIYKPHTIKVTT